MSCARSIDTTGFFDGSAYYNCGAPMLRSWSRRSSPSSSPTCSRQSASRWRPSGRFSEGMLVRTEDQFLYAFVENPDEVSLEFILRLEAEVGNVGARLVVLAAGRLPLALRQEVERRGGSVVDGPRFHELARALGLGALVGDSPPSAPAPGRDRLLPSARQLDDVMVRAKTWADWGIPPSRCGSTSRRKR